MYIHFIPTTTRMLCGYLRKFFFKRIISASSVLVRSAMENLLRRFASYPLLASTLNYNISAHPLNGLLLDKTSAVGHGVFDQSPFLLRRSNTSPQYSKTCRVLRMQKRVACCAFEIAYPGRTSAELSLHTKIKWRILAMLRYLGQTPLPPDFQLNDDVNDASRSGSAVNDVDFIASRHQCFSFLDKTDRMQLRLKRTLFLRSGHDTPIAEHPLNLVPMFQPDPLPPLFKFGYPLPTATASSGLSVHPCRQAQINASPNDWIFKIEFRRCICRGSISNANTNSQSFKRNRSRELERLPRKTRTRAELVDPATNAQIWRN
ncbi:hypothetical protein B0H16DRAFT_1760905 [Mycena metata]|uniref:Uncharacterized protein n=1 Tax=Mycena metata TaxID=1033252 RepID=A0AAD7NUG6_9AGAR|nr:hypothetical protein B0H16DRAFT_1760905 [Mycena metata]